MGNLIMWNIVTIDGFFEGTKNWDLPWHELIWSEDLEAFSIHQLENADGLLFGRVTYEGMYSYWSTEKGRVADYMNSIQKIVVSTTLSKVEWNNSILINKDIMNQIQLIKARKQKDIFIFGSSLLLRSLIENGLIDEYRIGIAPHFHGSGRRLFENGLPETDLKLMSVQHLNNDCAIVTYKTKK
jgi:dihydrofolate reductase